MNADMAATGSFRDLVAAERIKLLSLRATYVTAGIAIAVACACAFLLSAHVRLSPIGRASFDPLYEEFNAGIWGSLMVVAACAGAVTMTDEYSSALIRTTLTAVPARGRLMAAKAVALALVTGTLGAVVTAVVYGTSRLALAASGDSPTAAGGALIRDVAATLVALPIAALIGLAIGTVIRHPALASLTAVVLLAIVPSLVSTNDSGIQAMVSNAMPYHAWIALAGQTGANAFALQQPPSVVSACVWLALWPCVMLTLATLSLRRQDV